MANYGAMIDYNGQTFVTPQSTPFILYSKTTAVATWSTGDRWTATSSISIPSSYPAIGFMKANYHAALSCGRSGNSVVFSGTAQGGNVPQFTITCYLFARFPQPLPKWGVAIWDASGTCILTNESRPLSDLITIGTPGANGGINIDQTLSGSFAVMPCLMGATLFQVQIPGQQPVVVPVSGYTAASFNGSTTRINAASDQSGGGSPVGYLNTGVAITAINTASYD